MSLYLTLNRFLRTRQAARALIAKDLAGLERALYLGANPDGVARRCPRGYRGKVEHLLHVAVEQRWPEAVSALLRAGANTELRGGITLATPLFIAANLRSAPMLRLLAEHGADPLGLGWSVDQRALDQIMAVVGWDYPSQGSLISVREHTAAELVEYHNDPEEIVALELAVIRCSSKQCAISLGQDTPKGAPSPKPLPRL